ncbi:amylo-alpha-1,6-glucosidase [Homoserinimonas sp. A520]
MSGWNEDNAARAAATGNTTIVEGSSFSVSSTTGDILPGGHHGAYFQDTRFISGWLMTVNGNPIESLTAVIPEPYRAKFIGRVVRNSHRADTPLVVERSRLVGAGMREDLVIRNFSATAIDCRIDLQVEADFADLFEVKGGKVVHHWDSVTVATSTGLQIESQWRGHQRGLEILAADAIIDGQTLHYDLIVPARSSWSTTIIVTPKIDGQAMGSGFHSHLPVGQSAAAQRFRAWGEAVPVPMASDPALTRTLERSQFDLGALRISDPDRPDRDVVAAGAPWFMALFGRDSLLTSYMALPVDPSLALGTLQTLADYQGTDVNELTEEQPGRILHEVRLGVTVGLSLGGESVYYGSVDATPLFVVALAELRRWGQRDTDVAALLPAADSALDWIRDYGDSDGDGFVEYERLNEQGLLNQGWKDSWDGINFADGTLAVPPIALCEVQGYVYSAYLSRAYLARDAGDEDAAQQWESRAATLKEQFNDRFWMPEQGCFAIALDRDKQPVDACASNIGHCLWSGIIDEDKAPMVVDRLLSPEMFSGWGIRTLASTMGAYNPVSYHNGSVWPHDNAMIVTGLARYGFIDEANTVASGILDAAEHFDGRLPELFCGFDRADYPEPVPYPTSCSPQAWASATPIQLMRSLCRFDPSMPEGELWLAPVFPEGFSISVRNLPLSGARLSVDIAGTEAQISGLPEGIVVHRTPRPLSYAVPHGASPRS